MRKKLLCACGLTVALFAGCASGCDVNEMSSLKDFSRPYAAEYRCNKLQLGGTDLLGGYDFIKLKLGYFGDYTLSYAGEGGEGEQSGAYELSPEAGTLTLHAASGGEEQTYVFPYSRGVVYMQLCLGGKLLLAEFSSSAV